MTPILNCFALALHYQVICEMEVGAESYEGPGGLDAEVCRCDVESAAVFEFLAGGVDVDALLKHNLLNWHHGILRELSPTSPFKANKNIDHTGPRSVAIIFLAIYVTRPL